MCSRRLALRVALLPAILLVMAVAAACAPLSPVTAPATATVVPGTGEVSPLPVTPVPPGLTSPAPSDVVPPRVNVPLTATVAVTIPISPTAAVESGVATPIVEAPAPVTPTQPAGTSASQSAMATYRDEIGGWAIDYPEAWSLMDVTPQVRDESLAYSITLTSWKPQEPGTQGIPEGGSKVDIGVNKGAATSPGVAAESQRAEIAAGDPGSAIIFEEPWDLPGGLTGTHWTIQTSRGETVHELVTAINGNLVAVSGLGDPVLFEQIASTLRPIGAEARTGNEVLVPMVAAGAASGPQASNLASTTYTVKAGDTLAKIAARFGINVRAILAANPQITNPDRIYIGQRINIPAPGSNPTPPPPPGATRVNIYLIGEGGGSVGCGDQVVAVRRDVPRTAAPLTAALNLLLSQKSQYYGESGLYNVLYQSNLRIGSITRSGSAWTINLLGSLRLGGVCDNPRVKAQLEQTALQFSTVRSVRYFINGQPLDTVLSGR